MWSKVAEKSFLTSSKIPEHVPKTDMGAFSITEHESFFYIYVYWKELPKELHFGNNFSVDVRFDKQLEPLVQKINSEPMYNGTMAKFNISKHLIEEDLEFRIYSRNIEGISKNFTTLQIPKKSNRLKSPTNLKKVLERDRYVISWTTDSNNGVEDYTVFWCHSKNEGSDQCDVSGILLKCVFGCIVKKMSSIG